MFVRSSKFLEVEIKWLSSQLQLQLLTRQWNELVGKINKRGGEEFLDKAVLPSKLPQQFTQDEIEAMIRLCHPDKHNNSTAATTATQKLLALRKGNKS